MNPGRPAKAVSPRRSLAHLAAAGETGALYIDGDPGGVLFLAAGSVCYAESPAAPGLGHLLTASGRLTDRTWRAAVAAARINGALRHRPPAENATGAPLNGNGAAPPGGRPGGAGRWLVEHGHLTQGELELSVLNATYDAAFFALAPDRAAVRFVPGHVPWLGVVGKVDATALLREVTRRRRQLAEIHPSPEVDRAPIRPARLAPTDPVLLTGPQWSLVVHADGTRTAADLARLLGREAFATIADLRRLAAAGLVVPVQAGQPDAAGGDPGGAPGEAPRLRR
ncbi:MAG TPA: hypothetical protein VES42_15220, partial [Pilimelia sp.]|nr:hypothetical protein [Pilimelia sp.]